MKSSFRPYDGAVVAFGTMHLKEQAVSGAFSSQLGASLIVPKAIDTDAFGTFTGEVKRHGTMLDAARVKANKAMDVSELSFGLASEGSFGPHHLIPWVAGGTEMLVFVDRIRRIEICEWLHTCSTNFKHEVCGPADDLTSFLKSVGFPKYGLVVTPNDPVGHIAPIKGITCRTTLQSAIADAAAISRDGRTQVTSDMRAHMNPTRMEVLRELACRLAARISTPCPICASPGFGPVEAVRGLPCQWCGEATDVAFAELCECPACAHRVEKPLEGVPEAADPGSCSRCNP